MSDKKQVTTFAGLGDRSKPINFDFEYVPPIKNKIVEFGEIELYRPNAAKASAPPATDPFAGLGSPSDDEREGTFTKSALRFKAGDQIRVKSRGAKAYVLTYINPAMGGAYSIAATSPDGSIAGVFDQNDVVAA